MTDRELFKMALDALEAALSNDQPYISRSEETAEALRARLEQPEPEPITMVVSKTGDPSVTMSWWHEPALPVGTPLYTAPPQREWVGLTEEEMLEAENGCSYMDAFELTRYAEKIEAKLKEKNNG